MSARFLTAMKLDDDPWLPTAVGAAIEVHAQVLAARGERAEALAYLREQLKAHAATSLPERIRKNMNLLTLEGKPAPELDRAQWVGAVRPPSLAGLRGRPVLLFFWAHWCSDCKAEVGIVADLRKTFAAQRLAVIGPTRLYGYVQGGEEAPPERERQYIEQVRGQFYRPLADMPAPLSAANFVNYGASSTPTLVLIDRAGVVRWYHPGSATASELTERIRQLAAKIGTSGRLALRRCVSARPALVVLLKGIDQRIHSRPSRIKVFKFFAVGSIGGSRGGIFLREHGTVVPEGLKIYNSRVADWQCSLGGNSTAPTRGHRPPKWLRTLRCFRRRSAG